METNQIYIFMTKTNGFPKVFNGAVEQESQAKHLLKTCINASLKINYSSLSIKEEEDPEKKTGLYVLLEDRMMEGRFYPTSLVLQNETETQTWLTENPVGVERKFEEVEIMRPHEVIHNIFQNS